MIPLAIAYHYDQSDEKKKEKKKISRESEDCQMGEDGSRNGTNAQQASDPISILSKGEWCLPGENNGTNFLC
jgi:hypothetical protein